jgi:hypothetical protein
MQCAVMLFTMLQVQPTTGTTIISGIHNLTSLWQLVNLSQEVNFFTWDYDGATLKNSNNTQGVFQNEDKFLQIMVCPYCGMQSFW